MRSAIVFAACILADGLTYGVYIPSKEVGEFIVILFLIFFTMDIIELVKQ